MECRLLHGYDLDFSPNRWWWKFGPAFNLFLFLLLSSSLLLTLGSLWISSLFAWPDSEPLWQLLGGTLGEHVDGGGVLLGEGLGVKTLLDGLVPQLQLLPLGQLLELVILVELSLLVVILVSLQGDDGAPDLVGLVLQLVRVHLTKGQGLDADGQGDLHLLLHHLLLLGLGLCFLLVLLLLLDLLLLCSLLCCLLLLLLGTDLLPGGLFVLQPLQLSLLLGALVPPLGDVLPQLVVHLGLLLEVFGRRHGDE